MKNDTTQQEIILLTGTTFCRRELCENDNRTSGSSGSHLEKLEEACWNGLLEEWLPGIMEKSALGKKLCLSYIRQGKSLLEIQFGDFPVAIEKQFSIAPWFFLTAMFKN